MLDIETVHISVRFLLSKRGFDTRWVTGKKNGYGALIIYVGTPGGTLKVSFDENRINYCIDSYAKKSSTWYVRTAR